MQIVRNEGQMSYYLGQLTDYNITLINTISALKRVINSLNKSVWAGSARENFDTKMKSYFEELFKASTEILEYKEYVSDYMKKSSDFDDEMSNLKCEIEV